MALRKEIALTVFNSDPYEFESTNGQTYSGFKIQGFDETGVIHTFTSARPPVRVHDASGYDENRVQTFVLVGRTWDNKIKWREEVESAE